MVRSWAHYRPCSCFCGMHPLAQRGYALMDLHHNSRMNQLARTHCAQRFVRPYASFKHHAHHIATWQNAPHAYKSRHVQCALSVCVQCSLPSLLSCTRGGLMQLHAMSQEDGSSQCSFREELSWQSTAGVECMAVHASDTATHIALACNGSELGIWDLQKQQRSYHAKGNKPNRIGLVDKPWNTAAAFLPGSDAQKVVVGTAYHKLRLYDVKSRRPALDIEFGEAKVTALAAQTNGLQVWAANGMGKIECLDLRMNKLQGSLKGPGGAVKSLALHPELPIIASVGLDRFLRIHSVDSKVLLCKLYLKQHLTAVAWGSVQHQAAGEDDTPHTADFVASDDLKSHVLSDDAVEDAGLKRARPSSNKTAGSQKKGRSQRKKPKLPVQN